MPKIIEKMYTQSLIKEIINVYEAEHLSIQKLADRFGVKWASVRSILLKAGKSLDDKVRFTESQQKIISGRYLAGESLKVLATSYKVDRGTIVKVLDKRNTPRRPAGECNWQRWEEPGYREKHSAQMTGEKNMNWKGGITKITNKIRCSPEYAKWRMDIFHRDNFTCQKCGLKNGMGKRVKFEAHHKVYLSYIIEKFDIRSLEEARSCEYLWKLDIAECLCFDCHVEIHKTDKI